MQGSAPECFLVSIDLCLAPWQQDTELTNWNGLLFDMECTDHTNVSIWCHEARRLQGAIQSDVVVDKYEIKRDVPDEQRWAFKWTDVKQEAVTLRLEIL